MVVTVRDVHFKKKKNWRVLSCILVLLVLYHSVHHWHIALYSFEKLAISDPSMDEKKTYEELNEVGGCK